MQPPSNTRTGHGNDPAHGLRAGTGGLFFLSRTAAERGRITNSLSCRLTVEALDDRTVPSTVVEANFNNDDYMDKAEVTSPTIITVSLGSADGYTVSAILTVPKSLPVGGINVDDYDGDGNLDILTGGLTHSRFYSHTWLGNGDDTFGNLDTWKGSRIRDEW